MIPIDTLFKATLKSCLGLLLGVINTQKPQSHISIFASYEMKAVAGNRGDLKCSDLSCRCYSHLKMLVG